MRPDLPLHCNQLPLADTPKKDLTEWLMMPAARLFCEQLAAIEAESAITAMGHRLEQDVEVAKEDAEKQEQNATTARLMRKLVIAMQSGEFQFFTLSIQTHPYTTQTTIEGDKLE